MGGLLDSSDLCHCCQELRDVSDKIKSFTKTTLMRRLNVALWAHSDFFHRITLFGRELHASHLPPAGVVYQLEESVAEDDGAGAAGTRHKHANKVGSTVVKIRIERLNALTNAKLKTTIREWKLCNV